MQLDPPTATPYPRVKCKTCGDLFESQVKIDPAIYAMYPGLRVGGNTFTCPHCSQSAEYSESDFLYTTVQQETLAIYGKDIDPRNILILEGREERVTGAVAWVQPLTERLIRFVHDSGDWSKVSPRQLEEIVAEIFASFGYEVELTKRTRDGGRDVIAIGHSRVKSDKYLIECKHWEEKVGVSIVRELLGVGRLEPQSGLILVSLSGFTRDAHLQAAKEQVKWILSLKDALDVDAWIQDYANTRGWKPK